MGRIGALLLKGDWEGAVKALLGDHPQDTSEKENVREARCLFKKGDLAGALRNLPTHFVAEKAVLEVAPLAPASPRAMTALLQLHWKPSPLSLTFPPNPVIHIDHGPRSHGPVVEAVVFSVSGPNRVDEQAITKPTLL